MIYDNMGRPRIHIRDYERVAQMSYPVQCAHCGRVYDLGTVTVTARYADCSMWKTPCCNVAVDDRGETGWTSIKHYTVIDKRDLPIYGEGW